MGQFSGLLADIFQHERKGLQDFCQGRPEYSVPTDGCSYEELNMENRSDCTFFDTNFSETLWVKKKIVFLQPVRKKTSVNNKG
jgi:hypothetical protein